MARPGDSVCPTKERNTAMGSFLVFHKTRLYPNNIINQTIAVQEIQHMCNLLNFNKSFMNRFDICPVGPTKN
jgi:hypothetical protein